MRLADLLARPVARARLRTGAVALVHGPGYHFPVGLGGRPLHDPDRGARVVRRLLADGLAAPADVRRPPRATFEELALFHSQSYLAECWRPERLGPIFGATQQDLPVDAILDASRFAVGGTVLAARLALQGRGVSINLGGGFHHAEPAGGGSYCAFNDVGVAIRMLRSEGFDGPIAVVDLDVHHGNGTARGFEDDESVLTLSVHREALYRTRKAANLDLLVPAGCGDAEYLALLARTIPEALGKHGAQLVFYVAGADIVRGDGIGDLLVTELGAALRDRLVLRAAAKLRAPLVAVLAGGYGDHAWRCAYRLARLALTGRVFRGEPVDPSVAWFREASLSLRPHELQQEGDDGWELSEEDLAASLLRSRPATGLFLGYYSRTGIERALTHYGLFEKLRERGFLDFHIELDLFDRNRQTVRVLGRKTGSQGQHLLVELKAALRSLPAPAGFETGTDAPPLRLLAIEWLSLQDPTAEFTAARPRLPLQQHPGLGLATSVISILRMTCERLGLDGLSQQTAHFHGAVVVSREALYLDPVLEGRFRALRRALGDLRLAEASLLVERGQVLSLPEEKPLRWGGGEQVLPVSKRLRDYFAGSAYQGAVAEAERAAAFRLAR